MSEHDLLETGPGAAEDAAGDAALSDAVDSAEREDIEVDVPDSGASADGSTDDVADAADTTDAPEGAEDTADAADTTDAPEGAVDTADAADTTDAPGDTDTADDAADTADGDACAPNGCGGCAVLPLLGTACGPCSLDEYVCRGTDAVRCDGATLANGCGGCTVLPMPGTACGPCLLDEYFCAGPDVVLCDGATSANGCGGCEELPELGMACGPCLLDEYVCDGTEAAACDGSTACGSLPLGAACAADDDCASGACSEESDGVENDRCVPRVFAGTSAQMDFSYIPPGTFTMGSPSTEEGYRHDDEEQVSVTLTQSLAVMRTEVTQAQWMQATGSNNPSTYTACGDTCPVEQVTWYAAAAYANWLSENDGDSTTAGCYTLTPLRCADSVSDWADGDTSCTGATFTGVTCTGYRLLTEAEWEYAARAGTTTATYWNAATSLPTGGNLRWPYGCQPQPNLEPVAWYCGNAWFTTHEVANLFPNAWGLYDMLGNAWEWTTDWFTSSRPGGENPINAPGSGARVYRGGSALVDAGILRAAYRNLAPPMVRNDQIGFRLSRSLP